jgi:hypothetical protein
MAEVTAGNAVTVRPGDTLVVAFTRQLTTEESTDVAGKIAAGLPASIYVMVIDGVQALAVIKGSA